MHIGFAQAFYYPILIIRVLSSYHHQFLLLDPIRRMSLLKQYGLVTSFVISISPFYSLLYIIFPKLKNTSLTLIPSFDDVSINNKLLSFANFYPSSVETYLLYTEWFFLKKCFYSSSRSILFPTKIKLSDSFPFYFASYSQDATLSNDSFFVIS